MQSKLRERLWRPLSHSVHLNDNVLIARFYIVLNNEIILTVNFSHDVGLEILIFLLLHKLNSTAWNYVNGYRLLALTCLD